MNTLLKTLLEHSTDFQHWIQILHKQNSKSSKNTRKLLLFSSSILLTNTDFVRARILVILPGFASDEDEWDWFWWWWSPTICQPNMNDQLSAVRNRMQFSSDLPRELNRWICHKMSKYALKIVVPKNRRFSLGVQNNMNEWTDSRTRQKTETGNGNRWWPESNFAQDKSVLEWI